MSLSSVKAHRSMLSSVFRFKLPALGKDRVLQDLFHSFAIGKLVVLRLHLPGIWMRCLGI